MPTTSSVVRGLAGVGHGGRGYRPPADRPRPAAAPSRGAAAGAGCRIVDPKGPLRRSPLDHERIDQRGRPLDRRGRSRSRLHDGTFGFGI